MSHLVGYGYCKKFFVLTLTVFWCLLARSFVLTLICFCAQSDSFLYSLWQVLCTYSDRFFILTLTVFVLTLTGPSCSLWLILCTHSDRFFVLTLTGSSCSLWPFFVITLTVSCAHPDRASCSFLLMTCFDVERNCKLGSLLTLPDRWHCVCWVWVNTFVTHHSMTQTPISIPSAYTSRILLYIRRPSTHTVRSYCIAFLREHLIASLLRSPVVDSLFHLSCFVK